MDSVASANRRTLVKLGLASAGMFGFGFALAPLYRTFCRLTGFNELGGAGDGARDVAADRSRSVRLEFDANLRLPGWELRPLQTSVTAHPGEPVQARFLLRNLGPRAAIAQAVPSYAPAGAAPFLTKLECFCFARQALAPGEARELFVTLVVAPGLPAEVPVVTLSYTLFEVEGPAPLGRAS
ncbi:MAG TPA: cytochrome c oxidase assembly protein [Burkholderiales bacterium]|nr:cytochrome c oxidase assembly protein [Burkholderiales bacterium]